MRPCPSSDQLQQLLAEQLSDGDAALLAAHLEGCPHCQMILEHLTDCRGEAPTVAASPPRSVTGFEEEARVFLDRLKIGDLSRTASYESAGSHQPPPRLKPGYSPPEVPGYELLSLLGTGSTGRVYKARDQRLNRFVALKLFPEFLPSESERRARIHKEAEAAARLQHPHIVQIHEIGETAGRPYLALELVSGPTLAQYLDAGPLPPAAAAGLLQTLANAIQHAHERGIVHRDLKPANVMLHLIEGQATREHSGSSALFPKITDFGLAKDMDEDLGQTGTGAILGTPGYMAPEQAFGRSNAVGPATDIYALGAILYETLTGRPPFRGAQVADTLDQIRNEEPVPPSRLQPGIPPDLQTITLKCLQKEPWRRFATAADLAEDLRRFLGQEPISARPPSLWYQGAKFVRRHKTLAAGLGSTLAALIVGISIAILFAVGESRQRRLADENANLMEQAQREALWDAYRARLAVAQARLEGRSVREAAEQLNKAPPALRGWEWRHLHSRLDDSSVLFEPPYPLFPIGVHFLPGSTQVVVTSRDHKVSLWDAERETFLRTLADGSALTVASSTTQSLVMVRPDPAGPLLVVDEAGHRRAQIPMSGRLRYVVAALCPDGQQLALSWGQRTEAGTPIDRLALFDPTSGATLAQLPHAQKGECECLVFSPDGSRLAAGTRTGSVELWDVATRWHTAVWVEHSEKVAGVAFSPDGRRLLSVSLDDTFRQWDVATGRVVDVRRGSMRGLSAAAYSRDGRYIVAGGLDNTLRIWSAAGGEAVAILCGHTDPIMSAAYSADGRWIGTTSADGTVRLWDAAGQGDLRVLRGHTSYVYPTAYSPDGRWLASAGWDNTVRLWDAACGTPIAELLGHNSWVAALAITPDGRRLVSADHDGSIRIWDIVTGRSRLLSVLMHTFNPAWVHRLSVSPDGSLLAVGDDYRVHLCDLKTLEEKAALPLSLRQVRIAVFSPDGARLAVAGAEPEVQVVRVATGAVMTVLHGHTDMVNAVTFSPDGSRILTAGEDRSVRLWDASTGQAQTILGGSAGGHTGAVFAAVFHPDGTRIATAGRDRAIRIWDTATGEELIRLAGHTDYVYSLAFSPDGASLASGSGDHTLRLWDTVPLRQRFEARRELEALRSEAEAFVDRLLQEGLDLDHIAERLHKDSTLNERLRSAAWHAVLRRHLSADNRATEGSGPQKK